MSRRKKRTAETPYEFELERQAIRNKCPQCRGLGRVLSSNANGDEYFMRCPCVPPCTWEKEREGAQKEAGETCSDCPPAGYPTDKTRCDECPRRAQGEADRG